MATEVPSSGCSDETISAFEGKGPAEMILHSATGTEVMEDLSLASSQLSGESEGVVAVKFSLARRRKNRAEWLAAGRKRAACTDGLGAMRGLVVVLGFYLTIAMLGLGGWLLWYLLR